VIKYKQHSNTRLISKILFYIIFSIPLLRYYDLFNTGLGMETILTFIVLLLCIYLSQSAYIQHRIYPENRKARNWFILFSLWAIIVTIFYEVFTDINIGSIYANYSLVALIMLVIRLVIIYNLIGGRFDGSSCCNIYSKFVMLVIVVYIFQWGLFTAGLKMSFKLPFMDFTNAWHFLNSHNSFGMNPYPTSMFSERAHLAQYLAPYIALCLYSKTLINGNRILKALFASVVVITTVSGNGIIILLIEWSLYFLFYNDIKMKYRILISVVGMFLILYTYEVLNNIPMYQAMFNRLFIDVSGSSYISSKADYRIYRGFDLFFQLPLYGKFFGVGYNHMQIFANKFNIVSQYEKSWLAYEYFSTITQVLLYFGVIGFMLFYKHLSVLFWKSTNVVKGLIVIMVALWLSSSMFLNSSHIMYMLLIMTAFYSSKGKNEHQRKVKRNGIINVGKVSGAIK
jgi:hypothetical protein